MINQLSGKVVLAGDKFIVLDVNGVGYKVFAGPDVLNKAVKETEMTLWTHLQVREDAMELYGFIEYQELAFFEMLIQISGIGPKSALGLLAMAPLDTLKRAVAGGDVNYLTKVSGIGKKTAEKIIIELREKLGKIELGENGKAMLSEEADALEALQSLGYSAREAREALKEVPEGTEGTSDKVRSALKLLGKKR